MRRDTAKLRREMRIKKIIFFSLLGVVLVVPLVITSVFYLNYTHAFRQEPKVEIQAKNTYSDTLKAATDQSYEPFSYIVDGKYTGLDVELINETANRLEMNLDLELTDWNIAQAKLLSGEVDVILNMELDAVTEDSGMIPTVPTDEKQYVIYGYDKVTSLGGLYGKKIASYKDFPKLGLDLEILTSYTEIFTLLHDKKVDYVICPIQVGDYFIKEVGCGNAFPSYVVGYTYGCMALKQGSETLRDKLNVVIKAMQADGTISRLDSKWIVYRSGDESFFVVLEENPYLIVILASALVLGAMILVFSINETRSTNKEIAYALELEENLAHVERQNRELEKAHVAAEAANKAKTAFLFNMSHDIRTPMNAIIGFTDLAQKHIDDKKRVQEYLNNIESSGEHLLRLINNILEMSRIESNRIELDKKPVNLVALLQSCADMLALDAASQKKELRFEHDLTRPNVYCDELRLKQIVLNLLSNAVKFTREGGHILLSAHEDDHRYVIRIKDDGIGMSEEFQKNIYTPFEREHTSTVSGIQGTGLGMSIVQRLVQLMNGTISLQSEVDVGTEFTVTLLLDVYDGEIEESVDKKDAIPSEKPAKTARILVVDDNEINRIILSEILMDAGHEVMEASDGNEAVEIVSKAKEGDIDIVFMDVQMPTMNGYEATRAIREGGYPLSGIPIIAVTANAFEEDKVNSLQAGMNGHLAKPVNPEEVFSAISDNLD